MNLHTVLVRESKSVWDSNAFETAKVTDQTQRKDQGISSFSVFLPVKTQEGMLVRGLERSAIVVSKG
jgi:hypothetical protein